VQSTFRFEFARSTQSAVKLPTKEHDRRYTMATQNHVFVIKISMDFIFIKLGKFCCSMAIFHHSGSPGNVKEGKGKPSNSHRLTASIVGRT